MKVRPRDRFRGVIVPKEYRLSDDGRIICLTCHAAHGPGRNTYFLRRADPGASGSEGLCGGCHKAP